MTAEAAAVFNRTTTGTAVNLHMDLARPAKRSLLVGSWLHAATNSRNPSAMVAPDLDEELRREYVSRLWAEDWDNDDDAGYDEL